MNDLLQLKEEAKNAYRIFEEAREKESEFFIGYNEAKKASFEAWKAARAAEKAIRKVLLQRASKMPLDDLISLFEK